MAVNFQMSRDINGYNGYGLVFTDVAFQATLNTNSDTTITIPTNSVIGGASRDGINPASKSRLIAIFEYTPGGEVWVAKNTTAIVPPGATFTSTSSEMNPAAREVQGGDVLHFITANSKISVSVLLYWLAN